jgi:hypothetical protein
MREVEVVEVEVEVEDEKSRDTQDAGSQRAGDRKQRRIGYRAGGPAGGLNDWNQVMGEVRAR